MRVCIPQPSLGCKCDSVYKLNLSITVAQKVASPANITAQEGDELAVVGQRG